ncbi:MAG: phosphatidate cytidylyltransferase [Candidatus Marinimicrobia bacterium]|nr:phosphatidate cytidylyltransferase [Candidatus Neomarinimicrobiota bacterium]RPG05909.1 MAG: phosphatidate cytidylyltransferase [Pelagibacteraceae bacterium TMED247]|tara:strand:+ start:7757 stop:8413 length:657 start_codon:yes stop_codon:yes gene_type:complete
MRNIEKRILTSIIIFPLSIFFIIKGGSYLVSFLYAVLILGNFEVFSVFKKKFSIIFLDVILVSSLLSILFLRNETTSSFVLLIWAITITVSSDIGGYVFGKLFKWKKLTKISPNKTLSGVLGSFVFSLSTVFLLGFIVEIVSGIESNSFFKTRYFVLAIIFSIAAQLGDLTISYLKRLEKIKDTGKILPGHGGIFDRIDGLIFVIILAYIVYNLKLFP